MKEKLIPHPEGERQVEAGQPENQALILNTSAGNMEIEWAPEAHATSVGLLPFFASFLKDGQRLESFYREAPLEYSSPNASSKADIFGSAILSILQGHSRYAHVNTIRFDSVSPPLLGMTKTVSDDTVRRAIKKMDEQQGLSWLRAHLMSAVFPFIQPDWILDIDTTIKPVYGNGELDSNGYNPSKPGRPCHAYHCYFVAELRLCLGVDVREGKEHAAKHGLDQLWRILDGLPETHLPSLVRGDCGYGNETVLAGVEERNLSYLFRIRKTPRVKELINYAERTGQKWQSILIKGKPASALEATLKLTGWSRERQIVIIRETKKRKTHIYLKTKCFQHQNQNKSINMLE